jgi:hypothetical protein
MTNIIELVKTIETSSSHFNNSPSPISKQILLNNIIKLYEEVLNTNLPKATSIETGYKIPKEENIANQQNANPIPKTKQIIANEPIKSETNKQIINVTNLLPNKEQSLNEKLSYKQLDTLGDSLANKTFTDLNTVISLNERLLLIQNLFENDILKWEAAIKYLNAQNLKNACLDYVATIKVETNNKEAAHCKQLLNKLIDRKFQV